MRYSYLAILGATLFAFASVLNAANPKSDKKPEQPSMTVEKPRLAYVILRVTDLERSVNFYKQVLGMKEYFRYDLGEGRSEVAVGFEGEHGWFGEGIVLLHEPNKGPLEHGNAYSRYLLVVPDIYNYFDKLKAAGVQIVYPATQLDKFNCIVGFVKDPDGYTIELLQPLPKSK